MPVEKSFDLSIAFQRCEYDDGSEDWLPIITIDLLIPPADHRHQIPLLFDTGASTLVLRRDLYPLLGLLSWDVGEPIDVATGGGGAPAYRYNARFDLFGKIMDCPVHLMEIRQHPLYQGLLGRELLFEHFGFGFWESVRELYVALNP